MQASPPRRRFSRDSDESTHVRPARPMPIHRQHQPVDSAMMRSLKIKYDAEEFAESQLKAAEQHPSRRQSHDSDDSKSKRSLHAVKVEQKVSSIKIKNWKTKAEQKNK